MSRLLALKIVLCILLQKFNTALIVASGILFFTTDLYSEGAALVERLNPDSKQRYVTNYMYICFMMAMFPWQSTSQSHEHLTTHCCTNLALYLSIQPVLPL